MNTLKRHSLIGTLALLALLFALLDFKMMSLGAACQIAGAAWLLARAISTPVGACFDGALITPEQIKEFDRIMKEIGGGWDEIKKLPDLVKTLRTDLSKSQDEVNALQKKVLAFKSAGDRIVRLHQVVPEDCARHLFALSVVTASRKGHLDAHQQKDFLMGRSAEILGISQKAALTTSDIGLPTTFIADVVELVYKFGQARKYLTNFPLGAGQNKLKKLSADPTFSIIAVSGNVTEKSPGVADVTFSANKCGGIVRIPSEIDEDSIVPLGNFIARYGARNLARWEDTFCFLADGSAPYNSQSGIMKTAQTLGYYLQLATGNVKATNITLQNLRDLRAKVDGSIYQGGDPAYYMHPTMEALLCSFNTVGAPLVYVRNADGSATLDGFPVRWVGVLPVYDGNSHVNQAQVAFGDLSYWYFGERGSVRIDTSMDIYFASDEMGVRFLERFDARLMADQAMAVLLLAAS